MLTIMTDTNVCIYTHIHKYIHLHIHICIQVPCPEGALLMFDWALSDRGRLSDVLTAMIDTALALDFRTMKKLAFAQTLVSGGVCVYVVCMCIYMYVCMLDFRTMKELAFAQTLVSGSVCVCVCVLLTLGP